MPTLIVTTADPSRLAKSRIARDLTVALAKQGILPGHIMILFQQGTPYFGPVPAPETLVRVTMEYDWARDGTWRDRMLAVLRKALAQHFHSEELFLRMVPVDPRDHWNHALDSHRPKSAEKETFHAE